MKTKFNLKKGESLSRQANEPIIHVTGNGKTTYLWIGNDAESDKFCFGTIDGQKLLRTLANSILNALDNK